MTDSESQGKISDFIKYKTRREERQRRLQKDSQTPPQPQFNNLDEYALQMIQSTMPDDPTDNTTLPIAQKFPIDSIEFGRKEINYVNLDSEV